MNRSSTSVNPPPQPRAPLVAADGAAETLIIRMATDADAPGLRRLAELDSAAPLESEPILVAVVGGDLCAALSLNGARAMANPFRPTAEIVAMLSRRAQQLRSPTRAHRRWLTPRLSRGVQAGARG